MQDGSRNQSAVDGLIGILDLEEIEVNIFRARRRDAADVEQLRRAAVRVPRRAFWEQDRMALLEERLSEAELRR